MTYSLNLYTSLQLKAFAGLILFAATNDNMYMVTGFLTLMYSGFLVVLHGKI